MKRKFSNSQELHEFIFGELQSIVGVAGNVKTEKNILHYQIFPEGEDKCIWQSALEKLFKFFTKYELSNYIDFDFGYLRVYTDEKIQMTIGRL